MKQRHREAASSPSRQPKQNRPSEYGYDRASDRVPDRDVERIIRGAGEDEDESSPGSGRKCRGKCRPGAIGRCATPYQAHPGRWPGESTAPPSSRRIAGLASNRDDEPVPRVHCPPRRSASRWRGSRRCRPVSNAVRGEAIGRDRPTGSRRPRPRTAMSPMLVSFHQKEGASIAIGISGRMKPMPRNAATSTTARSSRSSASRTMLRRRTGRRSWLRRSTRNSVRIGGVPDDVGETLEAAVDIYLDE